MLFDKPTYDKLYKEVPAYKLITPSVVSERLKITGSLARRALDELQNKGNEVFFFNLFKMSLVLCLLLDLGFSCVETKTIFFFNGSDS